MPADDGSNNEFLQTDGSGNLSWGSVSFSISNDTTTNGNFYPAMSTATSGAVTGFTVSSSKLVFNPASGTMTVGVVTGSTGASGNLYLRSTSSGTKGQVYIDESTASSSTTSGALRVTGGVGVGGAMYVGGALSCASLTETSSIAYKENVNPIENALDKVLQLVGVTYDRKDGSSKDEAGLIAEEVADVIPNIVTYKDDKPEGINYTKLGAYLVEAIKELKDEIKQLKGQ